MLRKTKIKQSIIFILIITPVLLFISSFFISRIVYAGCWTGSCSAGGCSSGSSDGDYCECPHKDDCCSGKCRDGDGLPGAEHCHCGSSPPAKKCGDGDVNRDPEECDDGNTNNGDGCDSNCKHECGDITLNTNDELTRLSATEPLTLSWTYNQTKSHADCNPTSYTLWYVEKPSFDVADKSDCFKDADGNDITGTEITVNKTGTTNVTKIINNGSNNIDWQKPYCWKVRVNKDASKEIGAGPNSFRTNYAPVFSRAGIQFVDAGKTDMTDSSNGWGINPVNSGNPVCSSGWDATCNTVTNNSDLNLGGDTDCWIAGYDTDDASGQDHTIYLWFEYSDPDNELVAQEPNESQRHRLAFVKKNFFNPIETASNIQNMSHLNTGNTLFYTYFSNLLNSQTPTLSNQEGNLYVHIEEYNRILFDNNKVRIIYKIKFDRPNPNAWWILPYSGTFDIYTMMEHNVDDPNLGFTGENMADHFGGNDPTTGKRYQKIGSISIDTEEPEVGVEPPIIDGYHSFDLTWSDQTITQGSGLKNFESYCYSDNPPSFDLIYLGPYGTFPQTKTIETIDIGAIPTGYNECIPQEAKTEVINNGSAITEHSFGNDLASYRRFDDLVVATINAEDNACNKKDDPFTDPQQLFNPWITTRQGTVHSDGNIDINTPFEVDSSIRTDNSLYYHQWAFYNNTPPVLMRISSNMLSSQDATLTNLSLNNQKLPGYYDLNNIPRFGPVADSWYDYFKGVLINSGNASAIYTITNNLSITNISEIDGNTCLGPRCFYEIIGNLTIGPADPPAQCNRQALIFVDGNLTIIEDFTNGGDPNNGCIFIVKGNILFTNDTNTAPLDADSTMAPGSNTAPYNGVAGFFISETNSNHTIKVKKDVQIISNVPYGDGFVLRGGLIADNYDFRRNVGLRNNIQPAEILLYDPRYIILFDDLFTYSMLNIRDK
ncbi:hypothetical protein GF362_05200 [Candidatus Dojkabacteria bacterium]|nr:hypothetical protein [Candidatus Dojkabacteria bacterium]